MSLDCLTTTHLHVFEDVLHPAKGSLTTPLSLLAQSRLKCPTHPRGPNWKMSVFESAQMSSPLQNLSYALQPGELNGLHTSVLASINIYFNHLCA